MPAARPMKWVVRHSPLCPCLFGADFFYFVSKTPLCRGAHSFSMGHSSVFAWPIGGPHGPHTPRIVAALRGVWLVGRPAHDTRGPYVPTALLAPSG